MFFVVVFGVRCGGGEGEGERDRGHREIYMLTPACRIEEIRRTEEEARCWGGGSEVRRLYGPSRGIKFCIRSGRIGEKHCPSHGYICKVDITVRREGGQVRSISTFLKTKKTTTLYPEYADPTKLSSNG